MRVPRVDDLARVRVISALGAVASLLLAQPVWGSGRVLPAVPLVLGLDLPLGSGSVLWWSLLAAFAVVAWRASTLAIGLAVGLTFLGAVGDMHRPSRGSPSTFSSRSAWSVPPRAPWPATPP